MDRPGLLGGLLCPYCVQHHTYINHWVYEHECSAETGNYLDSQYTVVFGFLPRFLLGAFDMCNGIYHTRLLLLSGALGVRRSAPSVKLFDPRRMSPICPHTSPSPSRPPPVQYRWPQVRYPGKRVACSELHERVVVVRSCQGQLDIDCSSKGPDSSSVPYPSGIVHRWSFIILLLLIFSLHHNDPGRRAIWCRGTNDTPNESDQYQSPNWDLPLVKFLGPS